MLVQQDTFADYHPLVNFLYFALVFLFTMCFLHPISLWISLTTAILYAVQLRGKKAVLRGLSFLMPLMLMAALVNPAFHHEGMTILCYLPTGNPLTLESMAYGLAAAVMLAAVMLWFSCCTAVVTADKMIYLFGRVIPSLSLVLSMILRFVPQFQAQLRIIVEVQHSMGQTISAGSMVQRIKCGVRILSILITWALETAVDTADSMKSRGYGLPGRTAFSIYRIEKRDQKVLLWLIACGLLIGAGWGFGYFSWQYYPMLRPMKATTIAGGMQVVYWLFCLTPVVVNRREARRWKSTRSKI